MIPNFSANYFVPHRFAVVVSDCFGFGAERPPYPLNPRKTGGPGIGFACGLIVEVERFKGRVVGVDIARDFLIRSQSSGCQPVIAQPQHQQDQGRAVQNLPFDVRRCRPTLETMPGKKKRPEPQRFRALQFRADIFWFCCWLGPTPE
jgi:hypothetical protein